MNLMERFVAMQGEMLLSWYLTFLTHLDGASNSVLCAAAKYLLLDWQLSFIADLYS